MCDDSSSIIQGLPFWLNQISVKMRLDLLNVMNTDPLLNAHEPHDSLILEKCQCRHFTAQTVARFIEKRCYTYEYIMGKFRFFDTGCSVERGKSGSESQLSRCYDPTWLFRCCIDGTPISGKI